MRRRAGLCGLNRPISEELRKGGRLGLRGQGVRESGRGKGKWVEGEGQGPSAGDKGHGGGGGQSLLAKERTWWCILEIATPGGRAGGLVGVRGVRGG